MKHAVQVLVLVSAMFAPRAALMAQGDHTIMRVDNETRLQWMREGMSIPKAYIDPAIKPKRGSMSLIGYLPYIPAERNQGSCGNCWAWAATGVAEIAHRMQDGVSDRLSIQYIDSCGANTAGNWTCCSGNIVQFANWYGANGIFVPWSNANAAYADASVSYTCPVAPSSAVSCASIATSPHYTIASITPSTISTYGVGQATAIANVKNVLDQNKAISFSYFLADDTDWNAFTDFWNNNGEDGVFDIGAYSGHAWIEGQGGGHAVLLVGYNDDVADPYWIIVNSWGTANGMRPNGIFHVRMNTNYDAYVTSPSPDNAMMSFQTLDVGFVTPPIDLAVNKAAFSTTDRIAVTANVQAIPTPFYPFIRLVMPDGSTLYYASGEGFVGAVAPFLGGGPFTLGAPIADYPVLDAPFSGIASGTYYLEGGAVDATQTTSVDNLIYVGAVDRRALQVQ